MIGASKDIGYAMTLVNIREVTNVFITICHQPRILTKQNNAEARLRSQQTLGCSRFRNREAFLCLEVAKSVLEVRETRTNLSQKVIVDIREHFQRITVMRRHLPSCRGILNAEAKVRGKVSTMIGVEIVPNLTFLW
jgi:hypothetical protein